MSDYETYIHISKYARFRDDLGRRETWSETVRRYVDFFKDKMSEEEAEEIYQAIFNKEVMPSMRAMMTAGPALARDHAACYNCASVAIDTPRAFDEAFFLLMNGVGVGFSVERQYINQLPQVAERMYDTDTIIVVKDSKEGWSKALKELIALLYNGDIPKWDMSKLRPAGARLKTFGGRSSGPGPLDLLFKRTVQLFKKAVGRKLNSLECHDLMCHIADTVIVGGTRRSAMISFSNLTDDRMRRAKAGEFYLTDPQRFLSNNSVMYTEKPDLDSFLGEFRSMYKSKAGERGMVNQEAIKKKAISCGRDSDINYLLNPCGEAILRSSGGFCCLSEVVIRSADTFEDLCRKVRLATILGTLQSTLTDFRYLRKVWKDNAEDERLIGVSLTGVMDHPVMSGRVEPRDFGDTKGWNPSVGNWLLDLKDVARDTNIEWADRLGINHSKQLTLVKPSGTISQLVNSSSGMHPRYSKYYIRKVTQDDKDPLTQMLIDQGVPYQVKGEKVYFSFPVASPEDAITKDQVSAIEQLELWKVYRDCWCEGNPSQTIYYTDDNFLEVQAWVWENWDEIGGLSFFPTDDNVYEISPYNPITEEEYVKAIESFPTIDWSKLSEYESSDFTTSSQEFACSGGSCELV